MGTVSGSGYHSALTVRGIIGRYFRTYDMTLNEQFAPKIGRLSPSDQETEPYRFTGGVPRLQVQKGQVQSRVPQTYEYEIRNQPYEATMHFNRHDWRRDKTGQLAAKVAELGAETARHWDSLLTELIETGTTALCYDGAAFFASHTTGDRSGAPTNINLLTSSEVASLNVATAAKPTQTEAQAIILGVVSYLSTFKNEFNTPVNGGAKRWYVMVPPNMMGEFFGALRSERISGGESNPVLVQNYGIDLIVNQWLTSTTAIYFFRADSMMPCFFLQEEEAPFLDIFGPGSEYTSINDDVLFVTKAVRSVGFGEYLYSAKATLS